MVNLVLIAVGAAAAALFIVLMNTKSQTPVKGRGMIPYAAVVAAVAVYALMLTALGHSVDLPGASVAVFLLTLGACCLIAFHKKKDEGKRIRILLRRLGLVMAVVAVLELSVFNYSSYASPVSGEDPLPIETAELTSMTTVEGGLLLSSDGQSSVSWPVGGIDVGNVAVTLDSDTPRNVKVSVSGLDENFSSWQMTLNTRDVIVDGSTEVTIPLSSKGMIRIALDFGAVSGVRLIRAALNAPQPIRVNLWRLVLLLVILCAAVMIYTFDLHKVSYQPKNSRHTLIRIAAVLLCCMVLVAIAVSHISDNYCRGELFKPYDGVAEGKDPYYQQFDAFLKGRLDLDISADERLLTAGDSAYDRSYRSVNGIAEQWDRAYYDGKYYSYFGVAPLILFYYPVYLLTGQVPTTAITCAFFSVLFVIFGFMLVFKLARTLIREPNFLLTLLAAMVLPLMSGIFILTAYGDFYNLPKLCGLAFLLLLGYFTIEGYERPRWYIFLICGICVGIILAARPNLVLMALALAPLYIGVLVNRTLSLKNKLVSVAAFLLPIAAVGAGLMAFNAARFGSPFEFGTKYQITVNNIAMNNLSLGFTGMALFQYFLQPMRTSSTFPFFYPQYLSLDTYTRYFYITQAFGVLSLPLNWSLAAYPAVRKRSGIKLAYRATLVTGIAAAVVMAVTDFSMAGLTISYVCDIAMTVALAAITVMLLAENCSRGSAAVHRGVYIGALILIGLTMFIAVMVLLGTEPYFVREYMPGLYAIIQNLFIF